MNSYTTFSLTEEAFLLRSLREVVNVWARGSGLAHSISIPAMALQTSNLASSLVCLQIPISTLNTIMNLPSAPNPLRAEGSPHRGADLTVSVLLTSQVKLTTRLSDSMDQQLLTAVTQ